MKHLKQLLAAALTMFVAFAIATPAFAGSITITRDETYENGAGTGRTYSAYKVFDADTSLTGTNTQESKDPTYSPNGPISYSMATDSPWVSVFMNADGTQKAGSDYFTIALAADGSKYVVTPAKETFTADEAKAIASFLDTNLPSGLDSTVVTPGTPGTAATVDDGYYLLKASDGATNLTLVTTDVTIVEKNTYIGAGKTSAETSHYVGEKIEYTATVSVPEDASASDIVLHDTMTPAGALSFNNDVTAKVGDDAFTGFTVNAAPTDGDTFEITIPAAQIAALRGKTVEFKYTATVTSEAATDTGLVNTLVAEKNGYKTTPDTTTDYTFDFDFLKKFNGTTEAKTAKFELRTNANDASTALKFAANDAKTVYTKDDNGSTEIVVTNNAKVTFHGLKAGTYYLVETETSTGFNLLAAPQLVAIEDTTTVADGVVTVSHTVNGGAPTVAVEVINNAGTVLPSTGGMGTTIFYVVGGALVITAGVLLVTKRRMANVEA